MSADDSFQDTIGNTLDALVRPRVAPAADGVLRVAVLRSEDTGVRLTERVELAGLRVVYVNQGETVGDISDQSVVPPFDLLAVNMPDGDWGEAFSFALRFLRVRRPVAFILTGDGAGEFAPQAQERTRRLGYRVDGNGDFIVGTLWQDAFIWPTELTSQMVLDQVARDALARARG